jgi:hypothetical protein
MSAFRGYGRLALRAGLALGATAAVLIGESAGWLPAKAVLAVDVVCGLYVLFRVGSARISPLYLLLWARWRGSVPKGAALVLFLFGGRKHAALAEAKREVNRVAWSLAEPAESRGNAVRLLGDRQGRDTLETLREEILTARRRIHIATYILSPDEVGREIVSLLARRAREGLEVRLLVDAVGSWGMPLVLCRPLLRAGGRVARSTALPLQGKGSANWRNHRKLAVFDGRVAIIGGQNLGAGLHGAAPLEPPLPRLLVPAGRTGRRGARTHLHRRLVPGHRRTPAALRRPGRGNGSWPPGRRAWRSSRPARTRRATPS